MNLILIGFQNVGKSYFGQRVARLLDFDWIDLDDHILKTYQELGYKTSIAKLYEALGEKAFRTLEKRHALALSAMRTVISCGGGIVLSASAMKHLQSLGCVVYLQLPLQETFSRICSRRVPQYLDPLHPQKSFEKLYAQRAKLYSKYSDQQIDLFGKTEDQVLKELACCAQKANPLDKPLEIR